MEKTLRVYTEINIVVEQIGDGVINVLERTSPLTRIDIDFSSVYQHHFINFGKMGKQRVVEDAHHTECGWSSPTSRLEKYSPSAWKSLETKVYAVCLPRQNFHTCNRHPSLSRMPS